jgi:hypothetical protein
MQQCTGCQSMQQQTSGSGSSRLCTDTCNGEPRLSSIVNAAMAEMHVDCTMRQPRKRMSNERSKERAFPEMNSRSGSGSECIEICRRVGRGRWISTGGKKAESAEAWKGKRPVQVEETELGHKKNLMTGMQSMSSPGKSRDVCLFRFSSRSEEQQRLTGGGDVSFLR